MRFFRKNCEKLEISKDTFISIFCKIRLCSKFKNFEDILLQYFLEEHDLLDIKRLNAKMTTATKNEEILFLKNHQISEVILRKFPEQKNFVKILLKKNVVNEHQKMVKTLEIFNEFSIENSIDF